MHPCRRLRQGLVFALFAIAGLPAQQMVRDIADRVLRNSSSPAGGCTLTGNRLVFSAHVPDTVGREPYVTDGTPAGTRSLGDLRPGIASSNPTDFAALRTGSTEWVCFAADGPDGTELWRTDGTAAGTTQIVDLRSGPGGSAPSELLAGNGRLYFIADDGIAGRELWRTDGTAAGTRLVGDLLPGPLGSDPANLVRIGHSLYFAAHDGRHGRELWHCDTRTHTCTLVLDARPGPSGSSPQALVAVTVQGQTTPRLFCSIDDGTHGRELWSSDGTAAGTRMVTDLEPGSGSSDPRDGIEHVGAIAFTAKTKASGREVWLSGGTAATTRILRDIAAGTDGSNPRELHSNGSRLFFSAAIGNDAEPFGSDGTAAGTRRLADIAPGPIGSEPQEFTPLGSAVLFRASSPRFGAELWQTDGTVQGTHRVIDLHPGVSDGVHRVLGRLSNGLLFAGDDGTHGVELFRTDGTFAGTRLVVDLAPPITADAAPRPSVRLSAQLVGTGPTARSLSVFSAYDSKHGQEVWRTDGTSAGTQRVTDIGPGPLDGIPLRFQAIASTDGRYAMFAALDPVVGIEPWVTDGTSAGTRRLADCFPGYESSRPDQFLAHEGLVFFRAVTPLGSELWRTDGTPAGTRMVLDLNPGPESGDPADLVSYRGSVYFRGRSTNGDDELWRTDGTKAGTTRVADLWPGPRGSYPSGMVVAGDRLLFAADSPTAGRELWRTDGTTAGTKLVVDLWSGPMSSVPNTLTPFANGALFAADDGSRGTEPWWTDGTAANTRRLADVRTGPGGSFPSDFVPLTANRALFKATDATHGRELWATDGTATGTRLVADVYPGPRDGAAGEIRVIEGAGLALFTGEDSQRGREPWLTNGTSAYLLAELRAGRQGSEPGGFRVAEDYVLFRANDGRHGIELWRLWLRSIHAGTTGIYGTGCGAGSGSTPTLEALGTPKLGGEFRWTLRTRLPAGSGPAAVVLAATRDRRAVGPCELLVGQPWVIAPVRLNANGEGTLSTPLPNDPGLLGRLLFAQGAVVRVGGPLLGVADLTRAHLVLVGR